MQPYVAAVLINAVQIPSALASSFTFFTLKLPFLISLATAAGLFGPAESLFGITKARKKLGKMLRMENRGERKISRAVSKEQFL